MREIDIIKMMNEDEKCKAILNELNEKCKAFGISPTSEEYKLLREMTILKIAQHHEGIKSAIAKNVYYDLRGELVK